jgi:hypothetical protein
MPVELPLKPRQLHPFAKKQPSKNNTSGSTGGKKNRVSSGTGLQILAQAKKDAQQQTKDNKTVMILLPSGKRKFIKVKDLRRSDNVGK